MIKLDVERNKNIKINNIKIKVGINIEKIEIPIECEDLNISYMFSNEKINVRLKENFLKLIYVDLFHDDEKIVFDDKEEEKKYKNIFKEIIKTILEHEQTVITYYFGCYLIFAMIDPILDQCAIIFNNTTECEEFKFFLSKYQ